MENNNEKLTAQICAAYFGSKIKVANYEYEYDMCYLSRDSICVGSNKLDVDLWYKIQHCKLILTPLDKISDEDAIEVAKLLNCFYETPCGIKLTKQIREEFGQHRSWARLSYAFNDEEIIIINFSNDRRCGVSPCKGSQYMDQWRDAINYLRSKSYDCDQLITRGLAIEKE